MNLSFSMFITLFNFLTHFVIINLKTNSSKTNSLSSVSSTKKKKKLMHAFISLQLRSLTNKLNRDRIIFSWRLNPCSCLMCYHWLLLNLNRDISCTKECLKGECSQQMELTCFLCKRKPNPTPTRPNLGMPEKGNVCGT